jgi:hypothetical protein
MIQFSVWRKRNDLAGEMSEQFSNRPRRLMGPCRVALVFVFAGLGFKIAAAPLHFYVPDVYQGYAWHVAWHRRQLAGLVALMNRAAVSCLICRRTL